MRRVARRLVPLAVALLWLLLWSFGSAFAAPDAGAPAVSAKAPPALKTSAPATSAAQPAATGAASTKPKPKKLSDAGADAAAAAAAAAEAESADAAVADAEAADAAAVDAEAPAASATEAPSAAPAASEGAAEAGPAKPTIETAFVFVHNRPVFEIKVAHGSTLPKERANAAAEIIERIFNEPDPLPRATIKWIGPEEGVLELADRDVFGFGPDDIAASGQTREQYAESLRVNVDKFLSAERQRARLQAWVLSVILAVFLGVMTMFLLRWVRILSDRSQQWAESKAASLPALRFKQIEVLSAQALRSSLYVVVGIARVSLQIGLVYGYLAFSLGQFETTRPWVRQITGFLITPFGELAKRIGEALPAAVLLVATAYVVRTGLRVTGFFFDHLARGEVKSSWVPPELATPARPIARVALVLVALLALGPIVSGASDGLLVRIGIVGLATVALASVPVLGAITIGTVSIFTSRYRLGEWVTIGKHTGEITEIGFLDVCLVPSGAGRVRIPHLMSLLVPVTHLAGPPRVEYEVPIDPTASPEQVIKVLEAATAPLADNVEVFLVDLSSVAARYRVSLREPKTHARTQIAAAVAMGLRDAKIRLGAPTPTTN